MSTTDYNTLYGLLNPGTTNPDLNTETDFNSLYGELNPGTTNPDYPATSSTDTGGGGDTSGTGGTSGTSATSGSDIDWAKFFFGQYNLPQDLIDQIEALGKTYGTLNFSVFMAASLQLVRGSDWFKATYPGFAAGVAAGLFTDETGYRAYVTNLNTVYQQYLGRAVSGDETSAALAQGLTPDLIGRQFQGDAIAKVNTPQWEYATGAFDPSGQLTDTERSALGREQAGIDTPLGQMVQQRVKLAMDRAQALFGGTLATPSLSLAQGRLSAPSLNPAPTNVAAL